MDCFSLKQTLLSDNVNCLSNFVYIVIVKYGDLGRKKPWQKLFSPVFLKIYNQNMDFEEKKCLISYYVSSEVFTVK